MRIPTRLLGLASSLVLCCLVGCVTDPLSNTTSRRTVAEVQPRIRAGMPLAELLAFTRNTPILTRGHTRFMLADGDLWVIEGRDEDGTVTVKEWRFEKH